MPYLKSVVLLIALVVIIVLWSKKYKKWATMLRNYMINAQKKTSLTGEITWEKPWTVGLSRAMVIFLGFMAAVVIYAVLFSEFN